ncbi:BTB/POZ domain-containing protein 6-like isoform X2 [Lycorma delicatula]|uniref:BTB/POZ domain-containing protein 6-like isoform X2 n=1 Tax=Lycorma delicatula TaxID=130591 RepID=UPI003F5151F3
MSDCNDTVLKRLAEIMKTGEESDVEFIVGKGEQQKKIRGHKLLFKIASPVFKSLFFGACGKKTEVEIDDIDPAIFQAMMRYIYTGNFSFETTINAALVYKVADKYYLPNLRTACKIYMSLNLTPDDVCTILQVLDSYDETELKKSCINLIKTKTSAVLDSKGFIDCDERILKMIVNTDVMDVKEVQLFDAVNVWAIHNANKYGISVLTYAKKLKSIKNNIRFLSMTVSEFESGPAHSLLLSSEEQLNILLNIIRPGSKPLPEGFCSSTESRNSKSQTESKKMQSLQSTISGSSEDMDGLHLIFVWIIPNILTMETCNRIDSPEFNFANQKWNISFSRTGNAFSLWLSKLGGTICKVDFLLKIKSFLQQDKNLNLKECGVEFPPIGYCKIFKIARKELLSQDNISYLKDKYLPRIEIWMNSYDNDEECDGEDEYNNNEEYNCKDDEEYDDEDEYNGSEEYDCTDDEECDGED